MLWGIIDEPKRVKPGDIIEARVHGELISMTLEQRVGDRWLACADDGQKYSINPHGKVFPVYLVSAGEVIRWEES